MDRPRSPVQDAGRWVRSIPPRWCSPVAKHEERGRLPAVGRDDPARRCLFDCPGRPTRPPRLPPRRATGGGLELPPVHGLLKPARDHTGNPGRSSLLSVTSSMWLWLWLSPSPSFYLLLTRLPPATTTLVIGTPAHLPCVWPLLPPPAAPPWRRRRCPFEPSLAGVGQRRPRGGHGP